MRKLNPVDYKLLFELMKNARRSDRELAKILGVSQPTVSRRRGFLERELIDDYTAIPKWEKLGYEIFAITLVKTKPVFSTKEKYLTVRKRGMTWLMKQPNIIMGGAIEGIGMNSFIFSIHKNYSDYDEFLHDVRLEMGDLIDEVQTLLVNLGARERVKPLNFKYLAELEEAF
jgi:DNA-binding Lrp family transcriptional regulator